MYYTSRFNFLWQNQNKYFIYNSLSNSFLKINKDFYDLMINKNIIETEFVPQDLIDYLNKHFFILKHKDDDINLFKRRFIVNRYKNKTLSLTIAPTTNCNFKCPYCYEEGIVYKTISRDTERLICEYINDAPEENVRIDWYGGEPLLKFDTILRINDYVKNHKKNFRIGLITNGFLLTKEKINALQNYNVADIQITIDGILDKHESTRIHKDGEPTFNKIIENITYLLNNTNIFCLIRVNVSKDKNEYENVVKYFNDNFSNLNYRVYPGFVRDYSGIAPIKKGIACNQSMELKEQVELFRKNFKFNESKKYPSLKWNDCTARNFETYVITPNGDFFKCWEDIHDGELAIFNIHNKNNFNSILLNRYLFSADVLSDSKCLNCNVLPICGGGCPVSRIRHVENNEFKHNCNEYKNNIEEFLTYYYENTIN